MVEDVKPADEIKVASSSAAAATNGANGTTTEDVKPLTIEEAEEECKKQIEFYFSDANLPVDKFLFTLSSKDPQGWVPLATITTFKRMRPIMQVLDVEKVANILRSSSTIDVNEEGDKVKRTEALVPQHDVFDRSAYVKGFPEESETLQKEMEKFFDQFGKINSVRMRRDQNSKDRKKPFKGSVFVEFADVEELKAFLEKGKDDIPEENKIKFGDSTLKIMSKDAYCQMKMAEKGIDPSTFHRSSGSGSNNNTKKKFNAFKEMERHSKGLPSVLSEGGEKQQERRNKKEEAEERRRKAKEDRTLPLEFEFMETKLTTKPDGQIDVEQLQFPEKSVLSFKGAGEGGNWRDLKDTLVTLHPTSFVEFPSGAVEGAVGFKTTLDDVKLQEIVDKAITVGGQPVSWSRVDEDRARKFYLDRANFRAAYLIDQREQREADPAPVRNHFGGHSSRNFRPGRGGGGRGGGRGGRGGGRGGHHHGGDHKRKRDGDFVSRNGDKKAKTESA